MTDAAHDMARALRILLKPYAHVQDSTLQRAFNERRLPAGLGKHQPGEILLARLALAKHEEVRR